MSWPFHSQSNGWSREILGLQELELRRSSKAAASTMIESARKRTVLQYKNREELATIQLYNFTLGPGESKRQHPDAHTFSVEVPSNLILGRLDASTKRRYTSARGPGSDQPTVSPCLHRTRLTFVSSLLTACRALGRNVHFISIL